ncbi:hypothetical protein TcYC6_0081840 [Trypanosoma cruzi]|nr:hypothetical protein TcYC6_0081840 [Trypanosoma cruzi]
MLKVLHTKAAAEPILLATTCHNMNLFAIVTRSLVVVYRSTTLTVVTTFPLKMKKNETMVSACWSPSGRLLAIGLQCGELYLLDVESGDLIRRFVPRSDIAFAIKDAEAKTLSGIIDTSAGNEINNNEDKDGIDGDKEDDPLRQPPILPISVDGAIVACTWASVAPSTSALHSHNELCLPLSTTVSSPIFEELEREDDIPVMLLLDQRGGITFLPGGMQEVCVVVVNLQWALDPCRMRVDAFFVAAAPPLSNVKKGESNRFLNNAVMCGENTGSHSAYLVVQERDGETSSRASPQVVHVHLSDTIARVADREAVAICSIVEYCRMGKVSYQFVRKRWESLIRAVRKDLFLPQNALLLRDALMEDIARPSPAELSVYFRGLDLDALVKDTEELSRQFTHLVLQVSNVAYRCYDLALHLSQAHSGDRQRQCLLMDVIGGLRQRCSSFLRQMRLEVDREKDLVHWVVQRAAPAGSKFFASHPPLRAVRYPSLLRTLHRIARGESTAFSLVDENITRGEEDLLYIVKGCLLGGREAVARVVPLLDDINVESILQRQCEVLVPHVAAGSGAECVQLHTVTVTKSQPCQPLMASYTFEPRGDAEVFFLAKRGSVAVEIEPLQLAEADAAFLWSGVVDDGGRCVLLWERAAPSFGGAENMLVVAVVDENGAVEVAADAEDEANGEPNDTGIEAGVSRHAVLEIKGISTRHLRASVSRARGFGVFYANERFVVVDFYGG